MAATASFAELAQIDGLGYVPIDEEGSRLLFQAVSNAYETQSLIYATDIEFSGWGRVPGDPITRDLEYCWKAAERVVVLDDRHVVEDVMLADVPDYGTFTDIATPGRGHTDMDSGLSSRNR